MQEAHSWILRRELPLVDRHGHAVSPQVTQDHLLAWYKHLAAELQRRGVVQAPAPRAGATGCFVHTGAAHLRWHDQDTLGRLAEERLAARDHSLRGVPLLEKTVLEVTEICLKDITEEAAKSNAAGGPSGLIPWQLCIVVTNACDGGVRHYRQP